MKMNRKIVIMMTLLIIMLVAPLSTVAELNELDFQTAEIKSFTTLKLTKEELDEIYAYVEKLKMHLELKDAFELEKTLEKALNFTQDGRAILDEQYLSKIEKNFESYATADGSFSCSQTISQSQTFIFSSKSTELSLVNVSMQGTGPNIDIQFPGTAFLGRYGIKMILENIGDETAYDIDWTIFVSSKLFDRIRKDFTGHILIIEPGDKITIHTRKFFGFGRVNIEANLVGPEIGDILEDVIGRKKAFRTVI
jgi:hypothetical protein